MAPEAQPGKQPTPALIFDTFNAFQRTQALKTAIEIELFTGLGEGKTTAPALAERCGGTERAIRILCDFLTIAGFLTKQGNEYSLTLDSATFLDKRSPAYMGTVSEFILSPYIKDHFDRLTETVKNGGCVSDSALEPDHPMWVRFARAMGPSTTSLSGAGLRVRFSPANCDDRAVGCCCSNRDRSCCRVQWPRGPTAGCSRTAGIGLP